MEKVNKLSHQLKEVIELGLPIINGVNHTLGSRELRGEI